MTKEYVTLDSKKEYIKIHGLQRSGTNYISHLVNENFIDTNALVNLGGWKHGYYGVPWMLGHETHVLVVTKNPYAWLVSVYNYWGKNRKLNIGPDLNGIPFEDFVKNKIYLEKQKDIPYLVRATNPVQHWNNMNFHWLSIRINSKKLFVLAYEAVLENSKEVIKQIGNQFEVKQKKEFVESNTTFIPSGETLKPSNEKFNKEYYQKNDFMKEYSPELLEFVNSQLDLDVMLRLGYPIVQPKEIA